MSWLKKKRHHVVLTMRFSWSERESKQKKASRNGISLDYKDLPVLLDPSGQHEHEFVLIRLQPLR